MRTKPRPSVYDLSFDTIAAATDHATAIRIYRQLYRQRRRTSPDLDRIRAALDLADSVPLRRVDTTPGRMSTKVLFALPDGNAIETVSIQRRTGMTACVSSQVGCAFACTFCASGKLGLKRHLRAGEIVQQVLELGPRVNRIVFMGIGEPLHNYDQVLAAIRILRDRRGLGLKTSGITVSTIGIPAKLRRLREEHLKINLTISLHATDDDTRRALIPGARTTSITDVIDASQSWAHRHNRTVTYVYLLLPGINDHPDDARRLIDLLAGPQARINLMRWNPVLGGNSYQRIDDIGLTTFKRTLETGHLDATVRDTQGRDIDAACGQLWLRDLSHTV